MDGGYDVCQTPTPSAHFLRPVTHPKSCRCSASARKFWRRKYLSVRWKVTLPKRGVSTWELLVVAGRTRMKNDEVSQARWPSQKGGNRQHNANTNSTNTKNTNTLRSTPACQQQLMLHKPFRRISQPTEGYADAVEAYNVTTRSQESFENGADIEAEEANYQLVIGTYTAPETNGSCCVTFFLRKTDRTMTTDKCTKSSWSTTGQRQPYSVLLCCFCCVGLEYQPNVPYYLMTIVCVKAFRLQSFRSAHSASSSWCYTSRSDEYHNQPKTTQTR